MREDLKENKDNCRPGIQMNGDLKGSVAIEDFHGAYARPRKSFGFRGLCFFFLILLAEIDTVV